MSRRTMMIMASGLEDYKYIIEHPVINVNMSKTVIFMDVAGKWKLVIAFSTFPFFNPVLRLYIKRSNLP
jgi:hypothetical protein